MDRIPSRASRDYFVKGILRFAQDDRPSFCASSRGYTIRWNRWYTSDGFKLTARKEIADALSGCLIGNLWLRFVFCFVAFLTLTSAIALAQNTETKVPPVLDVHVHAMDESFPGLAPMCPNTSKFTASDPKHEGSAVRLGEGTVHAEAVSRLRKAST